MPPATTARLGSSSACGRSPHAAMPPPPDAAACRVLPRYCHLHRLFWVLLAALALLPRGQAAHCRMQQGAAHDGCGLPFELSNFQGHHKCAPSVLVGRPASVRQLSALVAAYPSVKAAGVGHSWWPDMFCAGGNASAINVVTTELVEVTAAAEGSPGRAIVVHEANQTVDVLAGVTTRTLLDALAAHRSSSAPSGYTLGSFPWFIDQTVGGAVATGTHGSSLVHGSLSNQLAAIAYVDAEGSLQRVTPSSDPHLFHALALSVGRLGVLVQLSFRIVQNKDVARTKKDAAPSDLAGALQQLQARYRAVAARGAAPLSREMWEVLAPWHDRQLFWFLPSQLVWDVTFSRQQPAAPDVNGLDGPAERPAAAAAVPPGAYNQSSAASVGGLVGMESNPRYWSGLYQLWLRPHGTDQVLPARSAFLSMSEVENRLHAGLNGYDQYEAAIPLRLAGDCMAALVRAVDGPAQLWRGFRSPALIRFVAAEPAYLSPSHDGPVMYINMEDHLRYAVHPDGGTDPAAANSWLQAVLRLLRSPVCGPARLHWGKAGWPQLAPCFDGAAEYGDNWCHFGCAAQRADAAGKFQGSAAAAVWTWAAADRGSGEALPLQRCCTRRGFDTARCSCMRRAACSRG